MTEARVARHLCTHWGSSTSWALLIHWVHLAEVAELVWKADLLGVISGSWCGPTVGLVSLDCTVDGTWGALFVVGSLWIFGVNRNAILALNLIVVVRDRVNIVRLESLLLDLRGGPTQLSTLGFALWLRGAESRVRGVAEVVAKGASLIRALER